MEIIRSGGRLFGHMGGMYSKPANMNCNQRSVAIFVIGFSIVDVWNENIWKFDLIFFETWKLIKLTLSGIWWRTHRQFVDAIVERWVVTVAGYKVPCAGHMQEQGKHMKSEPNIMHRIAQSNQRKAVVISFSNNLGQASIKGHFFRLNLLCPMPHSWRAFTVASLSKSGRASVYSIISYSFVAAEVVII